MLFVGENLIACLSTITSEKSSVKNIELWIEVWVEHMLFVGGNQIVCQLLHQKCLQLKNIELWIEVWVEHMLFLHQESFQKVLSVV